MTPEKYEQIGKFYQAALEREQAERAAFLAEACGADDSLRREVESLLAAHDQADDFIEQAPDDVAAGWQAAARSLPERGFSHYRTLSPLGRGGMGEVWLAEDMRLGRKVAVKLLLDEYTTDAGRLRRFEQEARAASALNHPNIITIHEIGEVDLTHYIVTEYVEGETLRQRINGAPQQKINVPEAIGVASQIAAALSAAHEAGIVHRDIKPENVMVRRDGIVKVLDFGLAKLTEPSAPALDSPGFDSPGFDSQDSTLIKDSTASGVVMGTPRYMSPEQARGEKLDARTDIFSLGVTLYEMIAGQAPFVGETPGEMIAAILRDEPPPLAEYAPETSPELQRLVGKALRKNREERYQGIKDLLLDLKSLNQHMELEARERTGKTGVARATSSVGRLISGIKHHKLGALLALVVVAGIAFGLSMLFTRSRQAPSLPELKFEQLTNNGKVVSAAISPDGKYVAYAESEAGKQSLWIRQTTFGNARQIVPPAVISYQGLCFSRDGSVLYYHASDDKNPGRAFYQIPVLGNALPKKVIAEIMGNVALSSDGKRLAFLRRLSDQGGNALMLAKVDGSGEQKLATINYAKWPSLAWSPDGNMIACSAGKFGEWSRETVILVSVTDGTQRQITSRSWFGLGDLAWLADSSGLIILVVDTTDGSRQQLWRLSYPDGEARKLTNDLNNYQGVSLAANSNMLVTMKFDYSSNIWVAPYGKPGRARQVTSGSNIIDGNYGLAWTPDDKIVYHSTRSGNADLWIVDADGGHNQQLTANADQNGYPSVSPDGRYVVFVSGRAGGASIWRMDIDGANPKQLTSSGEALAPSCSPDGRWVVYRNISSGMVSVWKVSIDGDGAPAQLISNYKGGPFPAVISPDGKLLAYRATNENRPVLNIIPFEGGAAIRTVDLPLQIRWSNFAWAPDGSAVIYCKYFGDVANVWKHPLDGGSPTHLTDFKSGIINYLAMSRDGKLALSRGEVSGNVALISNIR